MPRALCRLRPRLHSHHHAPLLEPEQLSSAGAPQTPTTLLSSLPTCFPHPPLSRSSPFHRPCRERGSEGPLAKMGCGERALGTAVGLLSTVHEQLYLPGMSISSLESSGSPGPCLPTRAELSASCEPTKPSPPPPPRQLPARLPRGQRWFPSTGSF